MVLSFYCIGRTARNMRIHLKPFNIYLAVWVIATCTTGCRSAGTSKKEEQFAKVRFHLEVRPDGTARSARVPVIRSSPVMVNVQTEPFLDERDVAEAAVMETPGGYELSVQFNEHGKLVLSGITTEHKGRRIVIQAEWPEMRWLAATKILRAINDGKLSFIPDADREECERIARGLNNTAALIRKKSF
jgi:hypothetical protein